MRPGTRPARRVRAPSWRPSRTPRDHASRWIQAQTRRYISTVSGVPVFNFSTLVKVRFAETDAAGIAHHASYLVWFETARVAYLAEHAGGYQALRDTGVESPVVQISARYISPAFFDENLRVHARCCDVRGARLRFEYLIERDGERIAEGESLHALVDSRSLRPVRVPEWLHEAIQQAELKGRVL